MRNRRSARASLLLRILGAWLSVLAVAAADAPQPPASSADPFTRFALPDAWEAKFWSDPNVKSLMALDPKALAELVPAQAGVRFCRCPACDATESDDTLAWAVAKPDVLTCRRCGVTIPNDKYPAKNDTKSDTKSDAKNDAKNDGKCDAKNDAKVTEEAIEVLPHVTHHYPYHAVPAGEQVYPDERLYLAAKRDDRAREFLAKAALYAAVRHHEQPAGRKDPALARLACTILVRFAQVYPAYAMHFDQPGQPKFFQQADLPPPYRRSYQTAKWTWTSGLDVPLNLVIAYALLRNDPALAEAGRLLDDPHPGRTIEHDLFLASAEFVRLQPEEFSEMSLNAYRGLLAVGRLLNDDALMRDALDRLDSFAERGFYHDGYWRQGDILAHRRVVGLIDGWIDRLVSGYADPREMVGATGTRRRDGTPRAVEVPMLALAREASAVVLTDPRSPEIQQVSWPSPTNIAMPRHPALLGGAGLARLALGRGNDALDLELGGLGSFGALPLPRQTLRLAIGGRTVLGDLDDLPPTSNGWDRASASHNTVVVDGLNQRESMATAIEPSPGADFRFFAADPDFQVVCLDDPRAYPQSTTRYRQTVVAVSDGKVRYALSVFEVQGGLQHDQIFHAAAGSRAHWEVGTPLSSGPASLLPPAITYVPTARAEDGRWFVQAYGAFSPIGHARFDKPLMVALAGPDVPGLRLHVLGDTPAMLVTAVTPDPSLSSSTSPPDRDSGRASLLIRRRSENGSTLRSTFVTLFEPAGPPSAIKRVGQVASSPGTVVIYLETTEGNEHVVVNLDPGTARTVRLADESPLTTDGLAVRVAPEALVLAGGTFAEAGGRKVRQRAVTGTIRSARRASSAESRGWFETDIPVPDLPSLEGRMLLIEHGNGTTRGWTIEKVENSPRGHLVHVREEPGFEIDATSGAARYYQFPRSTVPGPHRFRVALIAR